VTISMVPPASVLDPVTARSLVGVAGLPTVVATGSFDNQPYAEQLAAAFAMVRLQCAAADVVVPGRPGDVPRDGEALLRLLTSPSLCHGMSCRARQVARRHQLQRLSLQRGTIQEDEHAQHP
jgi:hypothetical protein